jgi:galactose mutarotase-like enzyme
MRTADWGTTSWGETVRRVVLGSEPGVVLEVLTLGATVHRLDVTTAGRRRNVVLGREDPAAYLAATDYVGATIGRYANRIAGARFELDGQPVAVEPVEHGHSLHAGPDGFDRRVWDLEDVGDTHAVLRLDSPDGDQGFPGHVTARVRFEVEGEVVRLAFEATTDAPTPVSLTSHAYFDLDGSGDVGGHELTVLADHYTPTDDEGIPTGELAPVAGTPYDLRGPRPLGDLSLDHNFVVTGEGLRPAAVLSSPRSGARMTLSADLPGLQVYTGDFLMGGLAPRSGIALEPQYFPDSVHHPDWPSVVLRPGQTYRSRIEWAFAEG